MGTFLDDDEDQPDNPVSSRIARPAPEALPPVTARGLSSPATQPVIQPTPAAAGSVEPGSTADLESRVVPRPMPIATPSPIAARTTADQAELSRLQSTGSGISQVAKAHPIGGGILRGLNVAGEIVGSIAPGVRRALTAIPGTEEHHNMLIGKQEGLIGQDETQAEKEAQTTEAAARAEQAEAAAEKDREEARVAGNPKQGLTSDETTLHDLMTGDNGQPRVNPNTQKPYTYLEAYEAVANARAGASASLRPVGKSSAQQYNDSILRELNVNPKTAVQKIPPEYQVNETDTDAQAKEKLQRAKDLVSGATGQQHIQIDTSKPDIAEAAQVERESRAAIRKAEEKYRDTQRSVHTVISSIDASKDGNGLLTSFVPTMEVLQINTANGVHRISPAEAQAANLPGGWVERFNAWFDKASTGKLTPELQAEGKQLAHILLTGAYEQYKNTYADESGIVSGYGGKDFEKRVKLIQPDADTSAASGNAGGKTVSFAAAKALPANKGKTDEQIKADIVAHGYQVGD